MKLERIDKISHRIVDGGTIIGFALQLANTRWTAFDNLDRRIGKASYRGPKEVLTFFKTRALNPTPATSLEG